MSGSVSKSILIGHLGKDPEIKTLPNGNRQGVLSLATSKTWKDAKGEKHKRTSWHRVIVYNKSLIENVLDKGYLKSGSHVCIEAEIEQREYEDKNGDKRSITEHLISAFSGGITMIDRKEGGSGKPEVPEAEDEHYDNVPYGQ